MNKNGLNPSLHIYLDIAMFSGSHLVSFEVTMPRLWSADYYPNNRARVMLKEDILDILIKEKQYVFIHFPFNINLSENQAEILVDALVRKGFHIHTIVTSAYGQSQQQYVMKRG